MLFNSLPFVGLVLCTGVLYYASVLRRFQVLILIVASFVFYGANSPGLLLLLWTSIAINAATSYLVYRGEASRSLAYATIGVVLNLATLAFFKYSPLISGTLFDTSRGIGEFLVSIPLPIGISFFTFQGITLVVDTLRQRRDPSIAGPGPDAWGPHVVHTTLFISFFPQLVAGPIVKAHDFIPQIEAKFLRGIDWDACFRSIVCGYFLKMVVADNLKDQTFWIAYPFFEGSSSIDLLVMLFGYSMQIFADFAGYSLIAIGIAGLFGYRLPQNFNFPYISQSISEFWRRWHISLSSFLKEYLYFPLGGNRTGRARTYINLMIVMLLGGLWHGAAWSYMVWGGFHGLALATERLCADHFAFRFKDHFCLRWLRIVLVFSFVTLAWLLFKLEFGHALAYLESIGTNTSIAPSRDRIVMILAYSLPVLIYHVDYLHRRARQATPPSRRLVESLAYGAMLFLLLTNSGPPGTFVYFQF